MSEPPSPPQLPGRWSVWSQASETPGGYFVIPASEEARDLGVKYAVVSARLSKGVAEPQITTIRTDPHVEGLLDD